jgi:LysR family glycine cleavage system transcriptional activator
MVIQAALAGRGLALGRSALVVDEILAGNLVIPIKSAFPSGFGHYLITAKSRPSTPNVDAFRDWIKQKAAECNETIDSILAAT